jgi:hypothetical protein
VHRRLRDDAFVSETNVESWCRAGLATRHNATLTLREGSRYLLSEACRVLGRQDGQHDRFGLSGRVETLRALILQGAAVSRDAVRLGPATYDVEFGYVALPFASADESGCTPVAR